MWLRFLALACLVGAAFAGPVQNSSETRCAKQCHRPLYPKLRLVPGKAYVYHYQSQNNITFGGSRKDDAIIGGTAEFHILTHCEGILKMKNIRIQQKTKEDEKDDLKKEIELPLPFAYRDGHWEHVCPGSKESKQSLNIKKGVLSSIVNVLTDLEKSRKVVERDGFGKCAVEYTVQDNGEKVILKEKDLKTCTNRPMIETSFLKKKYPIFLVYEEDHMMCEQYIEDGIFKKIYSREKQKLRNPLKGRETVKLSASIELNYIETKPAEQPSWQEPVNQEEIEYSIDESRQGDMRVKEVESLLKSMCSKNKLAMDMTFGKDFMKLVSLVRSLNDTTLDKIYESLKDGTICSSNKVRNMFADTCPVAATDPCIKLMVKMMVNDDVTLIQRKLWPIALTFRKNPTQDTVAAMIPLVKKDQSTMKSIAVATQIHNLCSLEDCGNVPPVNEIIDIFSKNLGSKCSGDDDKQKLAALTAFGNMGYHGRAHDSIVACVKDRSQSLKIRLAAIDSFRRMEKIPENFIQILKDKHENYEIRIALFPYILKHADKRQLKELKAIAEKESNVQVSSYMATCIQNFNRTSSPKYQRIKSLLQNYEIHPQKGDNLTHSKHTEVSTLNKALGVGVVVESNIIQSDKTEMFKSASVSLDAMVNDTQMNVLGFGIRAEGFEEILKNVIALKDKLPKLEEIRRRPTLEEFQKEFKEFSLDKVFGESRPELFAYVRALDTQLGSWSTSDLSRMGEMLQIADLMTKLAHGKDADFSHSFPLMNSKLVLPSITGRSYSIDLAGSSTVGLTAKAKADILNLPRNADVHFHFQPSVNLVIETTFGLESNTHRPFLKHVSTLHLQSDVEFKVEVRDARVAIARMTLPSENIALAKMSTDVVEIDQDHNEKSIFEKMQKKIDHCFEQLNKPLGVVACATVEVPKPFVIKTFPYVMPFGNGQISLKRSDVKYYEIRFEIPKQAAASKKYKVSFDTPGSKVRRRFQAIFEVKQQRDQKDVLLEVTSPFETVGGSGSLRNTNNLLEGSLELHTSETQIASANIKSKFTLSRSKKMYEVTGAYSIRSQEPTRVNGTVAILRGRKNQLIFSLISNKPHSKPIALKGTIMKEGRIELLPKSQWKLSSEISLQSPCANLKIRNTLEKRSGQSQAISGNAVFGYQLCGKKMHSLTISGTSQKSSDKINTIVKLESTQYSRANTYLTWDMQRESSESLNTELKLKYGPNLVEYILLKQKTRIPKTGPGHCSTTLDIPHRDIHYELTIDHEIDIRSEKPRINIEFDLCYKQHKHMKGGLDFKCESKSPLKASVKLGVEGPDARYLLEDEIEETSDHVIEGNSKFQWTKGNVTKKSHIHYKYKKLSDGSKVHHEIESSIQTPLSRSPIDGKASIELSSESLAIVGHVGNEYSVQAHLKEHGVRYINLKMSMIEGTLNYTEKGTKKTLIGDLKMKSQRIIGSAIVDLGDKKKVEIQVQPDVNHAPEKKILVSLSGEKNSRDSKDRIRGDSRLKVYDKLDVSLVEKGDASILGDHEFTLKVLTKNQEPVTIKFQRTTGDDHGQTKVVVLQNNSVKFQMVLDAVLKQTRNKKEISVQVSLSSQDNSIKDTQMYLRNQVTRTGSSQTIQTTVSFKQNDKVYKTEWNSDIQSNGLEVKAQIQTPHVNYEKNAVGFSLQVSDSSLSSSVNIACSDNKKISIQTKIETKNHELSLISKIRNSENATVGEVQVLITNHRHVKSLQVSIDKNEKRVCEIHGSMRKSSKEAQYEGTIKLSNLPEVKFQGFDASLQSTQSYAILKVNTQLINNEEISLISEIKEEGDVISATTTIATPYKNLKTAKAHLSIENQSSKRSMLGYVDCNGGRKGDVELTIISSSQVIEWKVRSKTIRTPEILAHAKYEKTGNSFLVTANVMKGTSPLLSTSFNRLSYNGGEKLLMKTKTFEDTLLDLIISKEVSSKNSKIYHLKAEGPFSPVDVTISRNYNDKNSVSTEFRGCRGLKPSAVCYSLKGYHQNMDYRISLEKSVGGSYSHTVGRLHLLMTKEMSKVTVVVNEKKYGYELKSDVCELNDRCSFDCYIYLPSFTSRVRASILHNERHVNLEAHVIPNTDDPTRKLSLEVKKETNPDNKEISGLVKLSHPRMSQPLLLTGKIRPVGQLDHTPLLYYGKLVLHSGPVWGKTLTFEVLPNIEQEAYGIRSMEYKIYTDDKSIDAYLKLNLQSSRSEKKIGYEWKYVKHDDEKRGGLTLTVSNKNGGRNIKVSFSSPSADYEVQGSVAEGPDDINFSISSAGRKLKELNIKISDSCAVLEFRKSAKSNPEIRSHICINKSEGKRLHWLQVNVQYRHHNCLDIRVSVDPEKPEYVDVVFKCNKQDSCRALVEKINELLRKLKQEIKLVVKQSKQDTVELLRNLIQRLNTYLPSKLENVRKESIKKSKEIKQYILKLIKSYFPTSIFETCKKQYQYVHEEATRYYRKAKEIVIRYWPPICEIGWYCNDIKLAFKNFKVKEAQVVIGRKVNEIKEFLRLRLPRFRIIYPSDVIDYIKTAINGVSKVIEKQIISLFGNVVGRTVLYQFKKYAMRLKAYVSQYANKVETKVRQEVIDAIDKLIEKVHHIFSQDEDLQTAQDLIWDAKNEIVSAWRNKEQIATSNARRVESHLKEDFKKVVDEQIQVLKYDPKEGEYRFRVQHLEALLRKLREFLDRIR